MGALGFQTLPDERRNHVRGFKVEVVSGTIQVDGEEVDRVEVVFLAICLGLHHQHLLGQPVGRVRLFGVADPEVRLLERHGRELGIRADRPDGDELFHAVHPALLQQLRAHHEVLVKELARMLLVGADAADDCGQVDDDVRPRVAIRAPHRLGIHQVVRSTARNEDLAGVHGAQSLHDEGADESRATGDHHASGRPEPGVDHHAERLLPRGSNDGQPLAGRRLASFRQRRRV